MWETDDWLFVDSETGRLEMISPAPLEKFPDISDIFNPIKWVSNYVRWAARFEESKDKGVWIGKRHLNGLQLSISPGIDIYHWAIMVNGCVYHVQKENNKCIIERTNSEYTKESFNWYIASKHCSISKSTLEKFSDNYEENDYNIFLENCQDFVYKMYAHIKGTSVGKAKLAISFITGTAIY